MIKVSVLYPNSEGCRFDMDYYCNRHMASLPRILGPACKSISVEQGVGGAGPGVPAPFIAMGHMIFDSLEAFQSAFAPHAAELMADIPNYTDITPTVQISTIVIG